MALPSFVPHRSIKSEAVYGKMWSSFTLHELLGKTLGSDYFGCSDVFAGEMATSGPQKGKLEVVLGWK